MKTVMVILDGRECEVRAMKARRNSAWLKKLEGPLMEAVQIVVAAPDAELNDARAIGHMLESVARILMTVMDTVQDLLIEYAPYLQAEIEEAYSDEVVEAFVEVVQLALPFGSIVEKLAELRALGSPSP